MSEVKPYTGNYIDENGTVHGDVKVYLSADFDRVTAERDALQERLNVADQRADDLGSHLDQAHKFVEATYGEAHYGILTVGGRKDIAWKIDESKAAMAVGTSTNSIDLEHSRYSWFQAAQAAEKRVEVLESQREAACLRAQELAVKLAERDALLLRWLGVVLDDNGLEELEQDTNAVLSASAEPSAAKCKTCNGSKVVDDGELTHSAGGIPYECGPIKCVKDCPDCGDTGLEPCSKHGWKP